MSIKKEKIMNIVYAYAKRYWLLLTFLGAGAGTGVVCLVVVHVHSSSPSKDVEQQKRIDHLEKALADALEQIQKKAADKGQLSPQEGEQLKKLSEQARNLKRLQRMKKGDGTIAPEASGDLGGAHGQPSVQGAHGTSGDETADSGQSKKPSLTPIDPEQQIAMMQAMLDDIEAGKQLGINKEDLNNDLPLLKKEETSNAAVKKDDGSRTTLLTNADEASREATVVEKVEKAVDQKIVQPAIKKSEATCNDEVAASVRRIVGDAIRNAM